MVFWLKLIYVYYLFLIFSYQKMGFLRIYIKTWKKLITFINNLKECQESELHKIYIFWYSLLLSNQWNVFLNYSLKIVILKKILN